MEDSGEPQTVRETVVAARPVLDDFAAVYREARYATHVVDERMRAAAVRSLGHLRAELTVRVG